MSDQTAKQPVGRRPLTLAETVAAEQDAIRAGTARVCGSSCACHGGLVCTRAAHPHDDDQAAPHAAYDPDGRLVQWVHTDEHGPTLTAADVAAQAAAARRDHTRAWLAGIDLDELRTAIAMVPPAGVKR